jgi:pimeloyl-ACP methyl ester carboxylesterase
MTGDGYQVLRRALRDGADSFDVTTVELAKPSRLVLFAVGAGGDPRRHLPLLLSLADHGCTVAAPHFERLVFPIPTEDILVLRARRLRLALDSVMRPGLPVAGVGHSIGTTMLLGLAGAQVWMITGQRVSIDPDPRLDRLVLLTPATSFLRAQGALDAVRVPILAWAGTKDDVTPPAQATFLKDALEGRAPVDLRIVEGAGHFSFMNEPPPMTTEPLPDRDAFLADLAEEVCRFVTT